MLTPDGVLTLFSLLLGVLIIVAAVPLVRRKVPPYRWYGLRIPVTMTDEKVWYETNAQFGRDLQKLGVVIGVTGVVLYFLDVNILGKAAAWLVTLEVSFMAILIRGWQHANALLERQNKVDHKQ